jgi:hypothetical protein
MATDIFQEVIIPDSMTKAIFDGNGFCIKEGYVGTYNIHSTTREYIGSNREYVPVGVTVAAYAYRDVPPFAEYKQKLAAGVPQAILRTADYKGWQIVIDYRGYTVYNTSDKTPKIVTVFGDIPTGFTLLKPATEFDEWNGSKWVLNENKQLQAEIDAANKTKQALMAEAQEHINIYQDMLDFDMADDIDAVEAKLAEWRKYRIAVYKISTAEPSKIVWPEKPTSMFG